MAHRLSAVLVMAVLASCASSTTTTGAPAAPQTIRVGAGGTGGRVTVNATSTAAVASIAHPVADVWRVLPLVFDTLAIPKGLVDPSTHVIGNQGMKIRQRLGSTPLSRFIECGTTQIGPNADSYEVYLTITTQVSSESATSTSIATTVDAAARPLAFAQEYARCSSKGILEQRIAEAVRNRLR